MSEIKVYSEIPFVATYDNVITSEECDHFINISKGTLTAALVSSTQKGIVSSGRTGRNTWLEHNKDSITKAVGEKISKIVGIPLENAEKYQVVHYEETQQYKQHYDSWEHNGSEKTLRCMKFGGARLVTALVYLNDVEGGGGTRMTKLGHTIMPKRGKMLVFHNTYWKETGSHDKHPLSEHAALPVEKGEKYAFNLWFKECPSKMLYSQFNPQYYSLKPTTNIEKTTSPNVVPISSVKVVPVKLHDEKDIFCIKNFVESELEILLKCKLSNSRRKNGWVNLKDVDNVVKRIEDLKGFSRDFYENVNVVEYVPNDLHGKHFIAYDMDSEKGKKYTEKAGQRLFTITIVLSGSITIAFPTLNITKTLNKGDAIIYKNTQANSNIRDQDLERTIVNDGETNGYIANIYIREFNGKGQRLTVDSFNDSHSIPSDKEKTPIMKNITPSPIQDISPNPSENIAMSIIEVEDYMDTLNIVLDKFKNNEVGQRWGGYESFKYLFRGDFEKFKQTVLRFRELKYSYPNRSCLNRENFEKDYVLDPSLELAVVENVLKPEVLELLQNFYKDNIEKETWSLGDRQAKRYKCHNEAMSRFLHYEILPLMEKITGKKLKPSYTYLSLYVKGTDLPGHTDRQECEYTVSFVIDKPKGSTWNIYVDKFTQPVKYKGRYPENPPKERCVPVDCDAGGMMMFGGTDHIHYRENLEHDYYNIVLLHYMSV